MEPGAAALTMPFLKSQYLGWILMEVLYLSLRDFSGEKNTYTEVCLGLKYLMARFLFFSLADPISLFKDSLSISGL
jgi:hypothetical protein